MQFSTDRSERITAIISTVVAVVILAGGVTAYQSHHVPVDDVVQLESDLRFQLEVGFRHDVQERAARLVLLERAGQAWQLSARTTTDHEQLAHWLLEATIRSMPGSIEPLPAIPRFGEQPLQPATEPSTDALDGPFVEQDRLGSSSPLPTQNSLTSNVDHPTAAPTLFTGDFESDNFFVGETQRPTVALATAAKPVRINLTELAARIAGYHEGLDEVETMLLSLDAADLPALGLQIRQLDEMTRDFQFVKMYYTALTDAERRAVVKPRTMTTTLAVLERQIDRSQAAPTGDFLDEFDAGNQAQIVELRQQLTEVANRVEW